MRGGDDVTVNEKAVVLLSGGLDSATLLHYVRQTVGVEVLYTCAFSYGQKHCRELECAAWQSRAVGAARHTVLPLDALGTVCGDASALTGADVDVPSLSDLSEEQRRQPPTYVPNRNMIFLSLAAAFAESHGVADVYYGAQAQDEYGYWDCTAGFVERINAVLSLNRRTPVRIHAPFVGMSKAEVLAMGLALGVDYARTWSCYRGDSHACGVCPTCVERLAAFREQGLVDPLEYAAQQKRDETL